MIKIPNEEENTKVHVNVYKIGLLGEVSKEQVDEIKENRLKIAKLRIKTLTKERKEIKKFLGKRKWK